jgi:hypothetical protein
MIFTCLLIVSCEDEKTEKDTEVVGTYLENGWLQYEASSSVTVDAYYNHPNVGTKVSGAIYHHGMRVETEGYSGAQALGYDIVDFSDALAANGFVGLSPIRMQNSSHDDGLYEGAIDLLKEQDDIKADKLALIGFSRGGLLSLHYVLDNPNAVAAVVLMSPSTGGDGDITFQDALDKLNQLAIPLMVTVGANDNTSIKSQVNQLINKLENLGKTYVAKTDYTDGNTDGGTHEWFYQVRDEYWPDIISFLTTHL